MGIGAAARHQKTRENPPFCGKGRTLFRDIPVPFAAISGGKGIYRHAAGPSLPAAAGACGA
jgi:hypothetical protein